MNEQTKGRNFLKLGGCRIFPNGERRYMRYNYTDINEETLAGVRQKLVQNNHQGFVPENGDFVFLYWDQDEQCKMEIPRADEGNYLAKDFDGKCLTPVPLSELMGSDVKREDEEDGETSNNSQDRKRHRTIKEENHDNTEETQRPRYTKRRKARARDKRNRTLGIKQEPVQIMDLTGEDDSDDDLENDSFLDSKPRARDMNASIKEEDTFLLQEDASSRAQSVPEPLVEQENHSNLSQIKDEDCSSLPQQEGGEHGTHGGSRRQGKDKREPESNRGEDTPKEGKKAPPIAAVHHAVRPSAAAVALGLITSSDAVYENNNNEDHEHDGTQSATTDNNNSSDELPPNVKEEQARQQSKTARESVYTKYSGRFLLQRCNVAAGIGRLGGSVQTTDPKPRAMHPNIWSSGQSLNMEYPIPSHLLDDNETLLQNKKPDMQDFTYLTFDTLWQPDGPKYAGQPYAEVDLFPQQLRKFGRACPVFMNRTLTKKHQKGRGKLLGWEYVGNYKVAPSPFFSAEEEKDNNDTYFFWESATSQWGSANNFSLADKSQIIKKTLKSAESEHGYGRKRINKWKKKLMDELKKDHSPAAPAYMVERREPTDAERNQQKLPPLAARARALGFREDMSDKELLELLVEINEFHKQITIEFVEYDERVYEYCKGGVTKHDRLGNKATKKSPPARAGDWYDFAEKHGLM